MDPDPVCGGGAALRSSEHAVSHHVQESRNVEHRHRLLYRMAVSAVGHQAVLEPVCGYHKDQAVVDGNDTVHYRSCVCGHRADPAAGQLRGAVAGCVLADRICFGHTRHSGGRILHAGAGLLGPVAVRGDPQRVLPAGDHHRAGRSRDGGRVDGNGFRECTPGMGGDLPDTLGAVPAHRILPFADTAPAGGGQALRSNARQTRIRSQHRPHPPRVRRHLRLIFPKKACMDRRHLHSPVPLPASPKPNW